MTTRTSQSQRTIPVHRLLALLEAATRADNQAAVRLLDKLILADRTGRATDTGDE